MADSSEKKTEQLSLALLTVNGLMSRMGAVKSIISPKNVHVLALCETRLKVPDGGIEILGFRMWRKDKNRYGGGVVLYVRDHIEAKERTDLMNPAVDIIWVEMKIPDSKPVLLGCCYLPEKDDGNPWDELYVSITGMLREKEEKEIFLMGDFSIDWRKGSIEKCFASKVSSHLGFKQIVEVPTRVTKTTATCIDHIYTNVPELCSQLETSDFVLDPGVRVNKLITITVEINIPTRVRRSNDVREEPHPVDELAERTENVSLH